MKRIQQSIAAAIATATALFAFGATAQSAQSAQSAASASQHIDELHVALIDVMKQAEVLGYDGRAEKLAPVIPAYFDTGFMAQVSLGSHWKSASEADQARFLEAFKRFMIANYAGQFDGFSGQEFKTLGEEPARKDTVLVKSILINPKDDDVELNYRLREVDGAWKIIDVYLDGTVSELALRRSEFSGIVRRENFDALIAAIDKRIEKLASGTES
jgi:phospholipid transport system substrate-binding protein